MQFRYDTDTQINNRDFGKPNEDLILLDQEHQIFFILDGITRVHQEYADRPGYSAALEAGQLFSAAAHEYILHNFHLPAEQLLRQAAAAGNSALRPFRQQRTLEQWQFYPGTLGILAMIRHGVFHYVYNGDCLGTLLRHGEKIHFGRQEQTKTLEELRISKADRYALYCNHAENSLGYGIFNGDDAMSSLLDHGKLPLQPGDVILLCTDGIGEFIQHADSRALVEQTPQQMLEDSVVYDVPPYAAYADDKTILRIDVL